MIYYRIIIMNIISNNRLLLNYFWGGVLNPVELFAPALHDLTTDDPKLPCLPGLQVCLLYFFLSSSLHFFFVCVWVVVFFFFFEFLNFILFIFLYSRFLLVIHFIHISVYMSIPIAQFITPPPHPPVAFPPLCPYVCSLHLCLNFCPANQFICTIFLGSTYMC